MAWPHYRETVTVVDLLETGACFAGVREAVVRHGGRIIAPTSKHVRNEYVREAANADGYGYGYGYGYGSGE